MNTKKWLNRGWKLNEEINALGEAQRSAFELAISISTGYDQIKVQSGKKNNSESKWVKYIEYSKKIDDRIDELYKIQQEIFEAIKIVSSSTYRTLLTERYINFKTWERIALDMNYSYMHITRLHEEALKEIKML